MKRFSVAVFILLFSFSFGWAQKNPLRILRSTGNKLRITDQRLLKKISTPTGLYEPYLKGLVARNRLSFTHYPQLARHNDILLQKHIDLFAQQSRSFADNSRQIAANLGSQVYTRVPYEDFLPKEVDVLYIGEIHSVPRVQQEIGELIKSLRAVYPERQIYLAAESIPAAFDLDFSFEDLISTEEALMERLQETAELAGLEVPEMLASFQVIQTALKANIPVLGLESEGALCQLATPKGAEEPTDEQYEQVVTSLAGMEFRNQGFAQGINMLREVDPDALIVVYGGIDHMAYHQLSALPSMVKGRSFVVQVSVPSALPGANPLFCNFREAKDIRRAFHKTPQAKLVEFWKEPTSFNQILGNDLTIIVHE